MTPLESYALVGKNGAGKSTSIEQLNELVHRGRQYRACS
jgi:ABC-type multidrug transport system ATPase subunit